MTLHALSLETTSVDSNSTTGETTTAGHYDSTYGIRSGLYLASSGTTNWLGPVDGTIGGPYAADFWHRGFLRNQTMAIGTTALEYRDNGGTPVFRIQTTAANTLQAQYWDGGAWVDTGGTFGLSINTLYVYDLKIDCGTEFEFCIGTNMLMDPPLAMSGAVGALVTNIDGIRAYGTSSGGNNPRHSEWIFGDEPTLGHRYAWKPPSGNGTDTAGSSDYTAVDEAATNDADLSTLTNNGDAETYTHAAMTMPAGEVKAVQIEARVRNVAGAAQNVKGRLRIGGVAYDQGANFAGIGVNWKPYVSRWATNPAGGSWTPTTAADVANEFGLLAQT